MTARENFGRVCTVTVNNISFSGLRCAFRIEQSLAKTPNKATLEIYNLSADHRAQLQEKWVPVVIEAGYTDQAEVIFRGELGHVFPIHPDTDWITKLEIGDGDKATQQSRALKSWKPGTAFLEVGQYLINQMGVGAGNALKQLQKGDFRGGLTQFVNGFVASDTAEAEWDKLMRNLGFDWSIQDGQMQILKEDEASDRPVPLLSPSTGLIGSPVHGEKNNTKILAELTPSLRPGSKVKIESSEIKGAFYKALKVTHTGDSQHGPWTTEIEAVPA